MPVEITWWGHATCTVEDSDVRVLTDPLFARRLAHLRRRRGARAAAAAPRVADAVLVSHLHADHLHCRRWRDSPRARGCSCPRGAARAVPGLRRLVAPAGCGSEVAPGDEMTVGDLVVRAVSARHDGRRLPFGPAALARARLCGERRGADVLRRGHRAVRRHGRGGRAGRCGAAAGGRLGALSGRMATGRGPRGRRRWPGWRRAVRCRCTTARTGRSAWTPCGRTNSTRRARSSSGRRRGWRREVAVHRLGHGESVRPEAAR